MKNIIVFVLFAVFVCARSDCDNSECADDIIKGIIEDTSPIENLDIKLEVPKFNVKNIAIKDLNKILLSLANWFDDKLNETNFTFKRINNKTKIFVKTFDFNVDFEKGNANIDVGLREENDLNKLGFDLLHNETQEGVITTTPKAKEEIDRSAVKISKAIKTNFDAVIKKQNDYRENQIYKTVDFDTTYYDEIEDNSTDYPIIDYIELYKDTTNEEFYFTATELPTTLDEFIDMNDTEVVSFDTVVKDKLVDPICHGNSTCEEFTKAVFPWVVAIFIKNNNENSQFEYFCDGALLSEKVILTGGRCMMQSNKTMEPHNVLVFLGKGNLQYMGGTEKLYRIKEIILHQNLSVDEDGNISNDLALLTLETSADLGDAIQSACIHTNETGELEEAGTTAWGPSGHLQPIFYEKSKSDICYDKNEDIFCATYGNNVPLCPSYGGIFATKRLSTWCLQGIFYGDPAQRGLCFNKNVLYTSLNNYFSWIDEIVDINKNVL